MYWHQGILSWHPAELKDREKIGVYGVVEELDTTAGAIAVACWKILNLNQAYNKPRYL